MKAEQANQQDIKMIKPKQKRNRSSSPKEHSEDVQLSGGQASDIESNYKRCKHFDEWNQIRLID